MTGLDRVLAFDAAGAACSAAARRDGAVVARRFAAMARGQSEVLVPMIREVMEDAGLAFEALEALAVTVGPGGFTGVRIGLATARALALAADRPLIGISNFEAAAAAVPRTEREGRSLVVALDAKRPELYLQCFDAGLAPLSQPALVALADIPGRLPDGPLVLAGDAAETASGVLAADRRTRDRLTRSSAPGHADAARVADLAAARGRPRPGQAPPAPLYLRAPDVSPPKSA